VVCALLAQARRARGCVTPGDDRLETRVYAVKRYLFRLGHAARSARFATSIEQLVVGLAPVMGWGTVPARPAERARFVRAHRKSVQRWLDYYNRRRPHGALSHKPPIARLHELNNLLGSYR
jgi:transposase InsO family protein